MPVRRELLTLESPDQIPDLVSFWSFARSHTDFEAILGEPYVLTSQSGKIAVVEDAGAPRSSPFTAAALSLPEGSYLSIPRKECPRLDIHGPGGQVTVIAWIKRGATESNHCEFIAGQWNETNLGRQYGLFLNIGVWHTHDTICGHLSRSGGPTPGFKYCMDGAFGATPVPHDEWSVVGMSYDGFHGYAWLNGYLDGPTSLNPYSLAGGLHDGGTYGSDFTVGAVHRSGEFGNFFSGLIAGIAVYDRALSPAEIAALSLLGQGEASDGRRG
jgi:hypothetical protein